MTGLDRAVGADVPTHNHTHAHSHTHTLTHTHAHACFSPTARPLIPQGDRERVRILYERLLDRTKHVKVGGAFPWGEGRGFGG